MEEFKIRYDIVKGKVKGIEDLGEGAFGSVLRCVNKQSNAKRAVKIGGVEEKDSFDSWRKIGRHRNVVELVEHFEVSYEPTVAGAEGRSPEWEIRLEADDLLPTGPFRGTLLVKLADAEPAEIRVSFSGLVR